MAITITVIDSKNHLAPNIDVFIKWKGGGTSRGKTNSSGQFDTGVNSLSTIEYMDVDGKRTGFGGVELTSNGGLQATISRAVT